MRDGAARAQPLAAAAVEPAWAAAVHAHAACVVARAAAAEAARAAAEAKVSGDAAAVDGATVLQRLCQLHGLVSLRRMGGGGSGGGLGCGDAGAAAAVDARLAAHAIGSHSPPGRTRIAHFAAPSRAHLSTWVLGLQAMVHAGSGGAAVGLSLDNRMQRREADGSAPGTTRGKLLWLSMRLMLDEQSRLTGRAKRALLVSAVQQAASDAQAARAQAGGRSGDALGERRALAPRVPPVAAVGEF